MKLILIRHGKTIANEKHLYCGSTDIGLSESGKTELKALKTTACCINTDGMRILTSGMKRCEETLSILFGDIPHETDPDLRETDFGAFEMRSYDELKADPDYLKWIEGDNEKNIAPGGESGEIMRKRALNALDRIIADGRDALIVTHGGVIAAITERLFPDDSKSRYDRQPPCGGGYCIDLGSSTCEPLFNTAGKT